MTDDVEMLEVVSARLRQCEVAMVGGYLSRGHDMKSEPALVQCRPSVAALSGRPDFANQLMPHRRQSARGRSMSRHAFCPLGKASRTCLSREARQTNGGWRMAVRCDDDAILPVPSDMTRPTATRANRLHLAAMLLPTSDAADSSSWAASRRGGESSTFAYAQHDNQRCAVHRADGDRLSPVEPQRLPFTGCARNEWSYLRRRYDYRLFAI